MLSATPIRKLLWFFFRPSALGVSCIVLCGNETLLVDYDYGSGWNFPTRHFELRIDSPTTAVQEGLKTEFGILPSFLSFLGYHICRIGHRRDTVYCFVGWTKSKDFQLNNRRIRQARWFPITSLPNNLSEYSREIVERWLEQIKRM
ncbi:NUDIX domain-containing protein [Candidatus Uhrbacteria bacterium]|nr:NUDIX domain-containing protein [Candidatus Uhrbacteria bacterium]